MSMHMVHAGLTTLNTGRNKKKPGVKQNRAAAEHDKWLRSQGLHPFLAHGPSASPQECSYTFRQI